MFRFHKLVRTLVAVHVLCAALATSAFAVEIEGVQPAALDQPRVNICLRRDMKGKPLAAGNGADQTINIQAFLDTGASGVLLSGKTADALGVKRATGAGGKAATFHDVGVGGGESFGVSEPLFVALASNLGNGGPDNADGYAAPFGPVRTQIKSAGGLIEMMTGGLDVVGMPAIRGRVIVLDPRPVDSFADTMRATVLDPKRDRASIPKVDLHVAVSKASFERFTHTEPAGTKGPDLSPNPFVGPKPVRDAGDGAKPQAAIPPVVVTLNGKSSSGSWLLDTGAAASMISTTQAKAVGVTYVEETRHTDSPKLAGVPEDQQFTLAVGGIGGQKTSAGFFLDTLTLPTREGEPIVYKRAPVLVMDITVEDPKTQEQVTLEGVLGMNYFVASANIKQAGLLPDIQNLTAGAYAMIVFDEPGATLGLKLKPEFLGKNGRGGAAAGGKRGTIEIKPKAPRRTR